MKFCPKCNLQYEGNVCSPCRNLANKNYRINNPEKVILINSQRVTKYKEKNQGKERKNGWTKYETDFLIEFYPDKGKMWCAEQLNKRESQVRDKASRLGLRQDISGEFRTDWQERAGKSKIGKKRPDQALVMKKNHADGKLIKTEEQCEAISIRTKEWHKNNEHPRGMLGKTHSEEFKNKMSEKMIERWKEMTEEEKDNHSLMVSTRMSIMNKNTLTNRAKASWKCGWREIGGQRKYFRSRWEANYARYLEWLKSKGEIQSWLHEPETFWFEGIKRGCVSYLPDFRVVEKNGVIAFHEVKGWMDDRSKTKINRMRIYHPTVKLIIIEKKAYNAIKKVMQPIIKDWEP